MNEAVPIPLEWIEYLRKQPESGMGYQVVSVKLKDGRSFSQVVASDGYFTRVRGHAELPFSAQDEIRSVRVTHKKWKFKDE